MRCLKITKKRFRAGVTAAGLLVAVIAQGREVTDATGVVVHLVDAPRRIVTLIPSLGELAADLAGDDLWKIVGVSESTDYPPALSKVESVGPYAPRFNLERVVALKPDLVLASQDGNPKDQVLHLRELGLPVVVVSTHTLQEIKDSIRIVSLAMGNEIRGGKMIAQLETGIEHVRERAKSRPHRKVLLQVGSEPLVVVGKKTFLHEALVTVGAENIYGDSSLGYPKPSMEDVITRNPDVILILAMGHETESAEMMAKKWQQYPRLSAVREHHIQVIAGDPIVRPTLRLLEGLGLLERGIYGK